MYQAWTELCHQILGHWEVQTMWNFSEECVETCSNQKMFANWLNMTLFEAVKNTIPGVVEKKFSLTIFCDMKETTTIDFIEKSRTFNSTSYCHLLKQFSPYLLNEPHIHIYCCLFHPYVGLHVSKLNECIFICTYLYQYII